MSRILVAFCLVIVSTHAAGAESYRLSLKDAISMAVEKNNLVRAAGFTAEGARHGMAIATSRYYPAIAFEEGFNVSSSPTQTFMMKLDQGRFTQNDFLISNLNNPGTQHDFRTTLTAKLPIFDPAISPAREIAVRESRIQDTRHDGSKQETAFKVFKLYLHVQKAQARLTAAEQAIGEARESMRLAGVRNKVGIGLRSDELRARTHLSMNEQQLISARNNLAIARMELASVIGIKESDSIDISESNITLVSAPQTPGELVAMSQKNRNELIQSQEELEKADATIRLARSSYLPSVSGFATYQLNSRDTPFRADNDAWNAGIALTWQLFDGFKRYHERDKAVAMRSAAAEMLEHARREAALQVKESVMRSAEMDMRLEVVRNTLKDAEETVRLLTVRFENSLATMAELLDAQSALNQTRADLVDSDVHVTLARGYVLFTAGTFFKEITK